MAANRLFPVTGPHASVSMNTAMLPTSPPSAEFTWWGANIHGNVRMHFYVRVCPHICTPPCQRTSVSVFNRWKHILTWEPLVCGKCLTLVFYLTGRRLINSDVIQDILQEINNACRKLPSTIKTQCSVIKWDLCQSLDLYQRTKNEPLHTGSSLFVLAGCVFDESNTMSCRTVITKVSFTEVSDIKMGRM